MKNSTRKVARVRKGKPGNQRAQNHSPAAPIVDVELVSGRLHNLLQTLQSSMSAVIVSVEALRRQDADADRDIALVLQQNVSDRLDIEIERISELIATLEVPIHRAAEDSDAA